MPRRLSAAILAGALTGTLCASPVLADPGGVDTTSTSASSDGASGTLAVGAALETSGGRQAARSAPSRPVCSYERWVTPPDLQPLLDALGPTSAVNVMLQQAAAADA